MSRFCLDAFQIWCWQLCKKLNDRPLLWQLNMANVWFWFALSFNTLNCSKFLVLHCISWVHAPVILCYHLHSPVTTFLFFLLPSVLENKLNDTLKKFDAYLNEPLDDEIDGDDDSDEPQVSRRKFIDGDTMTIADCNMLPKLNILKVCRKATNYCCDCEVLYNWLFVYSVRMFVLHFSVSCQKYHCYLLLLSVCNLYIYS